MDVNNKLQRIVEIIFVLIIVLFFTKYLLIFHQSFKYTKNFFTRQQGFSHLNTDDKIYFSALEAKDVIPANSSIDITPFQRNRDRIKARYYLYPLKLQPNWDYLIDFTNSFVDFDPSWNKKRLSTGVIIYSKPGFEFLPSWPFQLKPLPIWHLILTFIGVTFIFIITGMFMLMTLKIAPKEYNWIWFLGASYLLGFLILTTSVWVFLMFGGTLTKINIFILWGCIITAFSVFIRKSAINYWREAIQDLKIVIKLSYLEIVIFSFLLLLIIAILSWAIFTPVSHWDAMSSWIIKSKVFFHHKKIIIDYTHHNHYPLLWPINIAILFSFLDGTYDIVAKWTAGMLFLSFITQLIGSLSFLQVKRIWIPLTVILYIGIFFHSILISAHAEIIFLSFMTATTASLIKWLQHSEEKKFLALAIITAVGLSTAKFEGSVSSAFIGLSLFFLYFRTDRPKNLWLAIIGILLSTSISIIWVYWVKLSEYAFVIDNIQSEISLAKMLILIKIAISKDGIINPNVGIFCGISLVTLLLTKRTWNISEMFLSFLFIPMSLFSIFGMVGWEISEILSDFDATSARLFLHATPPLIMLFASLFASNQKGSFISNRFSFPKINY